MKNKILFLFLFILFFTNLNKSFSFDSDVYFKNTNTEKIIQDFVKNKELTNTDIYKLSKSVYELYDSWDETYKTNFFENVKCTTIYYIAAPSKKDIERNEKECLTKLTLNTIDKKTSENKNPDEKTSIKNNKEILYIDEIFTFGDYGSKYTKNINIGKKFPIILHLKNINKEIKKNTETYKKELYYIPDFIVGDDSAYKTKINKFTEFGGLEIELEDPQKSGIYKKYVIIFQILFIDKNNKSYKKITKNIYDEYKKTKTLKIQLKYRYENFVKNFEY